MATTRTLTVNSLAQGVSQQSAQQRRTTQCEAQYDCLNYPVEGVTARPGFDVVKKLTTNDLRGTHFFSIFRGDSERYAVFVGSGTMRIFNLLTGNQCTVTMDGTAAAYLTCVGSPKDVIKATTAEDVTFVANTEKAPAINTAAKSPSRPKEALFYFKAGSYKTTYIVTVVYSGTSYTWTYTTPDNSVEANEAYIKTDALCYAIYNAMTTTSPTVTSLGFSIQRTGSLMRLWRTDANDFEIDVSDGLGNTQLLGFKEFASGFDKLPQGGFDGMILRIQGDASAQEDDYYVQYSGRSATGVWEECAKPNIPINFTASTMPYRLINTGLDTFTFGPCPWGDRVVGDEDTAKDPSFVDSSVADIAFDNARLMILTERGPVWSRTNNPYVFFPDTVQARLATAPIDYEVRASKKIAIMRTVLQTDDDTFLWAEGRQFRVSTADQPFTPDSVAIKPASAYDFSAKVDPLPVGRSVLFVTENGPWSSVTDITISDGRVVREEGITDHAPKFVPKNIEWMAATDTGKKALLYSSDYKTQLSLYEWYLREDQRAQSAWSTWRLPEANSQIVSGLFDRNTFYLVVYRPDGTWLLKTSVAPFQVDGTGLRYLTRLDLRITEAAMTVSYNAGTDETRFLLPYLITTDRPYTLVVRTDSASKSRGSALIVARSATEGGKTALYVTGDLSTTPVYGGYTISSERTESQVFARDQDGAYLHMDRLQVLEVTYAHSDTGYYRIEVLDTSGAVTRYYPFEGRVLGNPENVLSQVVLHTGSHRAPIGLVNDQFRVRLVNDSYLPSAWQSAVWTFTGK